MATKQYNFKSITVVPQAKEFIDIVLSKTQRQTPTVIHPQYMISMIRSFYLRKIRFTQQTYHDKLTGILTEFPTLDDIHPFYADLINVLYDKDHYKLALGQINTARHLIDNVAKDFVRLVKFGDSLYRCKQLKKAALGRMCTIMKRQASTLAYLEQVRQHLSRLPSIDPNTRTIIVTGFPNVGKSSFINKVTRADVEVQPYAFTTKSLFVGHTDYKYLRWQVIDTPGLLDHPLEQRNTIEMQAITALAHLRACVLYLMDLSGTCGYTIPEQLSLFENIRPLFSSKPLVIVVNKIDIVGLDQIPEEAREAFEKFKQDGIDILPMSTLTEDGVMAVKTHACEKLLAHRIDNKLKAHKVTEVLHRLHVAVPVARDDKARPPCIPTKALAKMQKRKEGAMATDDDEGQRRLEIDIQREFGADYSVDLKKNFMLSNPEWNYDSIPEIIDGKNIADFIDADIMEKLELLEAEEEGRVAAGEYEEPASDDEERKAVKATALRIRKKKKMIQLAARGKANRNYSTLPRTATMREGRKSLMDKIDQGDDTGVSAPTKRGRSATPSGREKRSRLDGSVPPTSAVRERSQSRTRPEELKGISTIKAAIKARGIRHDSQTVIRKGGHNADSDRFVGTKMPKHLFSGKRGIGKTQMR